MLNIGITIAPMRLSDKLRQMIRKFEVFFNDCFVANIEVIKRMLIIVITGL